MSLIKQRNKKNFFLFVTAIFSELESLSGVLTACVNLIISDII